MLDDMFNSEWNILVIIFCSYGHIESFQWSPAQSFKLWTSLFQLSILSVIFLIVL